ncbi:hypothetical protein Cch01nite_07470 [Cellulomonas chitinilytica]|uniref:Uncharacterized protein n=1 Tax=Cellulomonas chitinilytica TaxID=398759 RepID=A0A919P1B1_9CELL|nr:hypothetical protein Cch01nite_07470 [Cellulomonas chitinilytica]
MLMGAVLGGTLGACTANPSSGPSASGSPPAAGQVPLPQGSEAVRLDPADFTVDISNPYWPMAVGDRWVYRETDDEGGDLRVEVTVLDRTVTVALGIEARVVHDLVTDGGAAVEDTYDLYAQDATGNVWYLGEDTKEYENGAVVSTSGSWEAGVDGASPGVVVPARPRPGTEYRQEHLAGEAEDQAVVLSVDEAVQTPVGAYTGALLTRDTTPLEPDVAELKLYAPGVGPVMTVQIAGGTGREVLVETTRGHA